VLASVRTDQAGQASGANNAIREVGGVLGVAVLASVFTGSGGYSSPQAFVDGLIPAIWVGAAVLAAGALVVLVLPFKTPRTVDAASAVDGLEADGLLAGGLAAGGLLANGLASDAALPAATAGGGRELVVVGRDS
jgi:hypothetical protein